MTAVVFDSLSQTPFLDDLHPDMKNILFIVGAVLLGMVVGQFVNAAFINKGNSSPGSILGNSL
jgi:hypothetical protein